MVKYLLKNLNSLGYRDVSSEVFWHIHGWMTTLQESGNVMSGQKTEKPTCNGLQTID